MTSVLTYYLGAPDWVARTPTTSTPETPQPAGDTEPETPTTVSHNNSEKRMAMKAQAT